MDATTIIQTVNSSEILEQINTAIDRLNKADSTKARYKKALVNADNAGVNLADPNALAEYAQDQSQSTQAFLKAAIKHWANHIANEAKAGATPDNVNAVQATIYRTEALTEAIKVHKSEGQKAHTWLKPTEVKKLLSCNSDNPKCLRDRVVLSLLAGAGLRREELVNLKFSNVKKQGERVVLESHRQRR